MLLPRRAKERIESEEPMRMQSSVLKDDPSRAQPYTESALPRRPKDRSDNVDPK
jgi:hypothetical protein